MAIPVVALTDKAIQNVKATDKPRRLFDGKGLHLLVNPDGAKYWRLKFLYGGKEKRIGLGVYPEVGLADAREKAAEARKLIAAGVDPSAKRKEDKATTAADQQIVLDTFEGVARAWYEMKRIPLFRSCIVTDHPNGATQDRPNGATWKHPNRGLERG